MKKLISEINKIQLEIGKIKKNLTLGMISEGVDDPGIFKCVFLAGGPGSGKSFTAKEVFGVGHKTLTQFSAAGLKIVNSDFAFETQLKKHGINPKDLGKIEKENPELWNRIAVDDDSLRKQAKKTTDARQAFYEAGRLGMIIDGTGDDAAKMKKKKDHAESLGYDCYMVFVNTTLDVALERNRNRDRTLSDKLVTTIWKDCQANLSTYKKMFGSNFTIIDNTVYGPIEPKIQKAINAFVRKPVTNKIAKKWIDMARQLKSRPIGS